MRSNQLKTQYYRAHESTGPNCPFVIQTNWILCRCITLNFAEIDSEIMLVVQEMPFVVVPSCMWLEGFIWL